MLQHYAVVRPRAETVRDYPLLLFVLAAVSSALGAGCEPDSTQDGRTESIALENAPDDEKDIQESTNKGSMAEKGRGSAQDGRGEYSQARYRMVANQLRGRDITNTRVLEVMRRIPRHLFVPEAARDAAYHDRPLPIGHGQTISQPYIVALMTQLADPQANERALDVGTGSGYQAAVLSELVDSVHSIEILEPLASEARDRLRKLGYSNVTIRNGDGYRGWPEHAPFDVIIVAAAPEHILQPLIDQLAPGGKLVIPVGRYYQELIVIEKEADGEIRRRSIAPVAFVPMTGEARKRSTRKSRN